MAGYDIHFHFDPVCPFAWLTSRWVQQVSRLRSYSVDWRFISLRIINKDVDYESHFPVGYTEGHQAGLRLLRVCAAARRDHGHQVVGPLYTTIGESVFVHSDDPPAKALELAAGDGLDEVLAGAGLPASLSRALDDDAWDAEVASESEAVLELTGRDVGTPIIQFEPPDGVAFFGPVISRLPSDADAIQLWDHVIGLASFPGFAEMKRSLREAPQFGPPDAAPGPVVSEDWQAGSRREARPAS
ncbi:MAG: hypothetical protein ACR2PK_07575 [Acidimicrobiales bacterium]